VFAAVLLGGAAMGGLGGVVFSNWYFLAAAAVEALAGTGLVLLSMREDR
jgi:hypothetical protein